MCGYRAGNGAERGTNFGVFFGIFLVWVEMLSKYFAFASATSQGVHFYL